jgi:hypothetical protein
MAIGGLTVWVVGLSPLANPAVWWRKLHACHCGPDIKIGIMQLGVTKIAKALKRTPGATTVMAAKLGVSLSMRD